MAMMQVVSAIDACSAANTEASLKASIAQGVTNKDLSDQVIFSTIQTHLQVLRNSAYALYWRQAE